MQAPFADPLSGLELLSSALPLVGRETQMQAIRAVLETVALNRPIGARAVMISGEMGMGKSRLLAEMYLEARARGFHVLEGRTYESGGMFPYLPFIEALRPVIRTSTTEELRQYIGHAYPPGDLPATGEQETRAAIAEVTSLTGTPLVAALARLFPDLPRMLHVTIEPEVLSPDQEKFRLFDAVATILERMALERPVLLGIDSLQWADSGSLELTMFLTVRLHGSHVALVGVTRPPTPSNERVEAADRVVSTAATRALGELMRQGLLLLLPLGPLDANAAEQHLHALLPGTFSAELAQSLLSRAGGNPFFLEELVRTLTLNQLLVLRNGEWRATRAIDAAIPESITLAVEQRLQGLSTDCRELLRVASLLGRTFTLDVLADVLEESEEQVQLLIDKATQAAVIARAPAAEAGEEEYINGSAGSAEASFASGLSPAKGIVTSPIYMFCQGIVQEALNAEVPTQRARALHGAIGLALEQGYADAAPAYAAELARHFVLSGDRQRALRWSLLAGEDAVRKQAHREAIGHFRTVLRLVQDPSIHAGLPGPGGHLPAPAQLYLLIGESWFKLGELEQAALAFQQALQDLRGTGTGYAQSLLLAQVNRLLADVYRMQGKYDQAMAHLQVASSAFNAVAETEIATNAAFDEATQVRWFPGRSFPGGSMALQRTSTNEHILLLQAQATLDMMLGRTQEAEAELWRSHQLAADSGDRGSQAFALQLLGWLRGWGEHIHEAIRFQEQAHSLYVSIGDPFRAALVDQVLGIVYQALGEMEHARLCTLRGFERARRYGARGILGLLYWNQGVMALAQGDWASSDARLQQALQEALANNDARLKPNALLAQAELQFRIGNWPEAERLFQSSIQAASTTEWIAGATTLYGHFLAVTGRRKAAQEQLDRAAAIPEPPGLAGNFYIPFLAEGYLHIESHARAAAYIERMRSMRGFMYYGTSVDRILGVVATQAGDWETAEQAFEDGLALCQRANNEPEEAAIYYEQARAALLRSGTITLVTDHVPTGLHDLCDRARKLFLRYHMQRAASLVDTVLQGVRELEQRDGAQALHTPLTVVLSPRQNTQPATRGQASRSSISIPHIEQWEAGSRLVLHLTGRELEVLRLVAEGHTDREVAEMLVISPRTVNRHLSNIFVKLDVPGRAAAVAYAIRQGIV